MMGRSFFFCSVSWCPCLNNVSFVVLVNNFPKFDSVVDESYYYVFHSFVHFLPLDAFPNIYLLNKLFYEQEEDCIWCSADRIYTPRQLSWCHKKLGLTSGWPTFDRCGACFSLNRLL